MAPDREREMFQLPRRPDKETAHKQLRSHLMIMGSCIAVIRVTPYILHFLTKEKEELKLEL
ncbi:mitochondrial import receptor subunit TOM6 [Carex littledalei]|uniref:Mitochondrial import receptor subunit TOM6 n=2 Tax=Carex littledalei TaxID=544730 RepID=A0A833R5T3_9POAL|nr:mitochondrial import receptor subunit TOM6 [Carex littledalei]